MPDQLDIHLDRLAPVDDLAGDWDDVLRRAGVRPHRRSYRIPLLAGGLAAAAVAAAIAFLITSASPDTASAAEVRAKVTEALGTPRSIRGAFTVVTRPSRPVRHRFGCRNCRPAVPIPSTFVFAADGSYAAHTKGTHATLRGPVDVGSDIAYDAKTGVQTSYWHGFVDGRGLYLRATNIDPATPRYSPEAQLAAWVRQVLAARSPRVGNTSFEGRSAWKLTLRFTPGDDFYDTYGVRVDVVVDRATGLVLQVTQYADTPDRWTSIESIHALRIGGATTSADFTVQEPAGVRTVNHDYGFRRVAVAKAAAIVGYRPLLPRSTGGRPLVDFAVASASRLGFAGVRGPVLRDAVSARYGRGLDSVVVTTRRGHLADQADLLQGISARTVKLTRGPLAGDNALLSTSPPNPGYLTAYHHGLIVQVFATSAREALAIAESLAPTG
jgi:hypothetical protein